MYTYIFINLPYCCRGPKQSAEYFNKTVSTKKLSSKNKQFIEHSLSVVRKKFNDANQVGPFQVEIFTKGKYKRQMVAAQVNQFLDALGIKG